MLTTKPRGKYNVQVCTNICCMLRGGEELFDHAKQKLGVGHKMTTADGQLTLEEVECIGACSWGPAMQVNYPDFGVPFTRIVEIKHATGQRIDATTIVREFPKNWTRGDEPYYPVPAPDARAAYQRYAELAAAEAGTSFIGRLATYRYYNMDQVTGMALAEAERLLSKYGSPHPPHPISHP